MRSVLTILAGACCASLALAQPATRTDSRSTTTTASYHRITTVVGTAFSLGNENLGKVVDVVFDDGGCIEYVLVQDAEGLIPVPWGVVTVNYEQKVVTVQSTTVTVDKLRELRFTEGRMPNFSDPSFSQKMTSVWGAKASRSGSGRTGGGAGTGGSGSGTSGSGSGATTPDRKGGTTPDRTNPGTTTPDRKGGTTPPDRTDPKNTTPPPTDKPGTTTPRGKDEPPAKDNPKNPPKKDKDKDGK